MVQEENRNRDSRPRQRRDRDEDKGDELDERVVDISRVAKVIKGGRRFAFRTVMIVGDNRGHVGMGVGKSRAVPDALRKATEHARKNMQPVVLTGTTIPHEITASHGGAKVLLKPASPGTGVIAAGGMRAVLEAAGVRDILTKSLGSANVLNVVYATMKALSQLKSAELEAAQRNKDIKDVMPFWSRKKHA